MKRAAVIGAGMSGAAAAWKLQQAGWKVTVFEKENFIGGRARTYRGDGYHLNTGAGFFTNFYPLLRQYLAQTPLQNDILENPKVVRLHSADRSYDYRLDSVASFMRLPWLRFGDKVRMLRTAAALSLKKKQLDLVSPEKLSPYDRESMADWARRKVGERAYQYLIRTAIEPYWYFSCEKGSAAMLMALTAWAAGARFFTLKKGMDSIISSLLQKTDLRLNTPISRIDIKPNGQISLNVQEGEIWDAVVWASTAQAACRALETINENLVSDTIRGFLESQQYAANINAYFFLPKKHLADFPPQLSPTGPDANEVAAIATHGAQVDIGRHPDQALIGIWLKDRSSRDLLDLSESETWDQLRQYLKKYLSAEAHPALKPAWLSRRQEAIPLHAPGRYRQAAQVWAQQKPPLVFAGDYLTTATLEGAMSSGFRAAEILIHA